MRRSAEVMRRAEERRQRADGARRLHDVVPELESLELEIHESREGQPGQEVTHKRYIIVARAPALFEIPCSDRKCCEGGHDVTATVMQHLLGHDRQFEGRHVCAGHLKDGDCAYELRFVASARYASVRRHRKMAVPAARPQPAAR
jgi:hypothetical protein